MNDDEIIKFIKEVFQQEFPFASVNGWLQSNGNTISGNLNNGFLFGTKFYAQSSKKKYLHFTKAESAIKILDSSSLWLSNLNAFNDEFEFLLASERLFHLSKSEIQEYKDKIFAASFTELHVGQNVSTEFPYHWQRYADKGKGVAFEFKFKQYKKDGFECFEDPALFPFYYLMRVQYCANIIEDTIICRLKTKINNLRSEINLIEFLFPFICAYKREKEEFENFMEEKEIRLIYSDGTDSRDYDFYCNIYKEATFSGLTLDNFKPFRQIPFTISCSGSNETFLNLTGIYLGVDIDEEYKLQLTEISNREKIQLQVG